MDIIAITARMCDSLYTEFNESKQTNALSSRKRKLDVKCVDRAEIVVANKERVAVNFSCDERINTLTDKCEYDVVERVLRVSSLTISVRQLVAKGNAVLFTDDGCQIFNKADGLFATACLIDGLIN